MVFIILINIWKVANYPWPTNQNHWGSWCIRLRKKANIRLNKTLTSLKTKSNDNKHFQMPKRLKKINSSSSNAKLFKPTTTHSRGKGGWWADTLKIKSLSLMSSFPDFMPKLSLKMMNISLEIMVATAEHSFVSLKRKSFPS